MYETWGAFIYCRKSSEGRNGLKGLGHGISLKAARSRSASGVAVLSSKGKTIHMSNGLSSQINLASGFIRLGNPFAL